MDTQKILIALSLDEDVLPLLQAWGKRFDWTHVSEVHFLHIVKKNVSPLEFGLIESPDDETFKEIKPSLEKYLKEEACKIIPAEFHPELSYHVVSDFFPDEETVEISKKVGADMVIVAPHKKQGLFHRSFTRHLIKSSPCDVYVVKPQNHGNPRAA